MRSYADIISIDPSSHMRDAGVPNRMSRSLILSAGNLDDATI